MIIATRTFYFYTCTLYFLYTYTLFLIHIHLCYQISKKTCALYSQRADHMISKKVRQITKSLKRIRYLQERLKSSDI